jgi:hypothetical protein
MMHLHHFLETSNGARVMNRPRVKRHTSETAVGFGMGIPVGIALSLGESFIMTVIYLLHWLWDTEFLDNDILDAGSPGVAIRFGG